MAHFNVTISARYATSVRAYRKQNNKTKKWHDSMTTDWFVDEVLKKTINPALLDGKFCPVDKIDSMIFLHDFCRPWWGDALQKD